MKNIWIIYLVIGSILSIPVSISYIYAQWFVIINIGWDIFSLSGLMAILFSCYLIFITPLIKVILWLLLLIMWLYDPNGYSFLKWLAPGFYVSIGS